MAVTVTVMRGAQETEIIGLGAAAERIREDVIDLQQVAGAAAAPAAPVHVAAAALIALPDLPLDRGGDGAAGRARLLRLDGGGARRPRGPLLRRRGRPLRVALRLRRRSAGGGGRGRPFAGATAVRASSARSIAGEFPAPAGSAADSARFFGAEVCAASAGRLAVRRPRGGRAGSWRSSASRTNRPMSWPAVRCGSTWERRPLSRSSPCRQSSSITALISHRPAPSGRIRSAGAASSGAAFANNSCTCRVLLPAACSTSTRCAAASIIGSIAGPGVGRGSAGRAGPDFGAVKPAPAPARRPARPRLRS